MKTKDFVGEVVERTAGECVEFAVNNAVDYGDGCIEELRHKLDKLTEIVAAMLDGMQEERALEVLKRVHTGLRFDE